jgi:hypothetical protein
VAIEWKYVDEDGAADLAPWLVVGPGQQAAVHFVSVFLARMRQSQGIEGDVGFQTFDRIVEMYDRSPSGSAPVRSALELLLDAGMAERRGSPGQESWRATVSLTQQIAEAFDARPALPQVNPDNHQ